MKFVKSIVLVVTCLILGGISVENVDASSVNNDEIGGLYDSHWVRFSESKVTVGVDPELKDNQVVMQAVKKGIDEWNQANSIQLKLVKYGKSNDIKINNALIRPQDPTNRPGARVIVDTPSWSSCTIDYSVILLDTQNTDQTVQRLGISKQTYYDHLIIKSLGKSLGLREDNTVDDNVLSNNPTVGRVSGSDQASLRKLYSNLDQ